MKGAVYCLGILALTVLHCEGFKPDDELTVELSHVKSIDDFCKFLTDDDCNIMKNETYLPEKGHSDDKMVVSASAEIAMFDACNPREMTVALPHHPDPDITVWPSCTRAKRCGGCCTSDVFSCEPTETKDKYVRVFDTRLPYPGAHRFQFLGVRVVKLVEHTQCDAQCKTKPHECHKYQNYEARKCRCVCREERLSLRNTCNSVQIWDDTECDCICPNRNTVSCPEPSYFSTTTCKCTLKTGVTGEIDLDKLFEQIDKGLMGTDIILNQGGSDVDKSEKELDMAAGKGKGEGDDDDGTDEDDDDDDETSSSSTSSTSTTSTTTTTTTTTTPKPTKDPCADKKCFGDWKGKLLRNNVCACRPPSMFG